MSDEYDELAKQFGSPVATKDAPADEYDAISKALSPLSVRDKVNLIQHRQGQPPVAWDESKPVPASYQQAVESQFKTLFPSGNMRTKADADFAHAQMEASKRASMSAEDIQRQLTQEKVSGLPVAARVGLNAATSLAEFSRGATANYLGLGGHKSLDEMNAALEGADPWTKYLHGASNFAGAALPIGRAAKAVGGIPAMAAYGAASTEGGLTERAKAGVKAGAFAWLAGRLSSAAIEKFDALPDGLKTAFTEKAARVVAHGASFSAVDALFNGPDPERAIESFVLGAGMEMAGGKPMAAIKGEFAGRAIDAKVAARMGHMRQQPGLPALPEYIDPASRVAPEDRAQHFAEDYVAKRVGTPQAGLPEYASQDTRIAGRTGAEPGTPGVNYSNEPRGGQVEAPAATGERVPALPKGEPPPTIPAPWTAEMLSGARISGEGLGGRLMGPATPPQDVIDADFVRPSGNATPMGGGPGAGERGAAGVSYEDVVNLGKKALEKSGLRSTWEGLAGTGFFAINRESPRMGAYAAKADAANEWGAGKGVILDRGVQRAAGILEPKYDGSKAERFDAAKVEEQLRAREGSFREMGGVKGNRYGAERFKELFPTEADYKATVNSPEYRRFVAEHMKVQEGEVRRMNTLATGQELPEAERGIYTGVRSNLVPLAEETGGKATGGPRISKSTVGREATMRAEDYDFRSSSEFGKAASQAQRIHATRMMFGEGVKDGTAVPYTKGMKSAPEGYSAFNVEADKGLAIPTPEGGEVEGRTIYLKNEVVPEVRRMFGFDRLVRPEGVVSKIGRGLTKIQMAAPVDKIFHSLNLSGVAYRLGGWNPKAISDSWKQMGDPDAAAEETMRQAKWGGSKPRYSEAKSRLGQFVQKYSIDLDRIDLAVRKVVLDQIEARIKKGDLPDTPKTRRDGLLQAGNYHAMSMDSVTAAMRTLGLQPFAVASKTMMANALRSSPMGGFSSGLEAGSAGKAVKLRALVAAKWVAYLGTVGAWNFARSGEFAPAGLGVAVLYKGDDGKWVVTDLPGAATGFSRMYRTSGTKALAEGKGIGGAAESIVDAYVRAHLGGPATEALAESFGARVGLPPYAHGGGGLGQATKHANAYVNLVFGLIDSDDLGEIGRDTVGPLIPRTVEPK